MPGFPGPGPLVRLCVGLTCILSLWNTVSAVKGEAKKEKVMTLLPPTGKRAELLFQCLETKTFKRKKRQPSLPALNPDLLLSGFGGEERKEKGVAFLDTTELPARSVDLSALNLTELVNGMLSRALKDTKKFFSLLSITSYSSVAFHKFSVAIYNISNLKAVDPARFPTRYCYCLNNRTNDLSDFTALLVDVVGNSTSYLTEIFKSTSILSVSQTNESDCTFICMMTGKSGRNLSDFWEVAEKSPVINYTFTSSILLLSSAEQGPTKGSSVTSMPTPTSQQTLPRTSPPHGAQSTGVSSLRTVPWTETTPLAKGEQTQNPGSLPELHSRTAATRGSASPTPALATRRVARTPWVTTSSQAWTSNLPVPWAQTMGEKAPGGPPWETSSSTPTSPAEAMTTWSLSGPPAGAASTQGSSSQASPASGTFTLGTQTPNPTKAPAPRYPQTGDAPLAWPFAPGEEPALAPGPHQVSRCPQLLVEEGAVTASPLPLAIRKLNPCLMELCRFFQQCLCMSQKRDPRMEAMR
uniref:HHLA1 neighbor of OC90 n=1 Tax=Panthera tigris altaica TaxID=74533 RepID=A0A8C9K910_PANTA